MAKSKGTTGSGMDAYTGMLWLSLVATLIGIVFIFLDWNEYSGKTPPDVKRMVTPPTPPPQIDQGGAPAPAPGG